MFDELGAALAALSHDLPLVLILEDLQWADVDTINALARLAESQIPSKLLIVGTCCDGEWTAGVRAQDRLRAVAATAPRSVTLPLGSLTLEHVARYIDARFGPECLSDLAPAVHHATGGNPFMMVNAIDSLVARQLVVAGPRRLAMCGVARGHRPRAAGNASARSLRGTSITSTRWNARRSKPRRPLVSSSRPRRLPPRSSSESSTSGACWARWPAAGTSSSLAGATGPSTRRTATYRFRHALYADLIAQQAPMLRQLRVVQRLSHARDIATPDLTRRRA